MAKLRRAAARLLGRLTGDRLADEAPAPPSRQGGGVRPATARPPFPPVGETAPETVVPVPTTQTPRIVLVNSAMPWFLSCVSSTVGVPIGQAVVGQSQLAAMGFEPMPEQATQQPASPQASVTTPTTPPDPFRALTRWDDPAVPRARRVVLED